MAMDQLMRNRLKLAVIVLVFGSDMSATQAVAEALIQAHG